VTPHVPVGLAAALKANVGEGPVPADATWAQVTASVPG